MPQRRATRSARGAPTAPSPFQRFATAAAHATGTSGCFVAAAGLVVLWAATGPLFDFSDTWQLVINTGTTILTFLVVFLIQNTQNRDTRAMQVKLDELIRAVQGAHVALLDLEDLSEEELEQFRARYVELAQQAREAVRRGGSDTGTPNMRAR